MTELETLRQDIEGLRRANARLREWMMIGFVVAITLPIALTFFGLVSPRFRNVHAVDVESTGVVRAADLRLRDRPVSVP